MHLPQPSRSKGSSQKQKDTQCVFFQPKPHFRHQLSSLFFSVSLRPVAGGGPEKSRNEIWGREPRPCPMLGRSLLLPAQLHRAVFHCVRALPWWGYTERNPHAGPRQPSPPPGSPWSFPDRRSPSRERHSRHPCTGLPQQP